MGGPSASLPARIRELRTERKLSQDRLAVAIGVSKSSVQYFEAGKLIPQEGTAERLDNVFGTGSEIQGLAKTAHEDLRPWLRPWVEHERRALLLRAWEPMLIPGLLQREPYMRQLFATLPANAGRIDELVTTRLGRQAVVFERESPLAVTCLVGEFALRQGTPEVLKDQLGHLVDVGHQPSVNVKIIPQDAGMHAGLSGPISLASLPDGRRVGYLDDQLRGRVATSPGDVAELELAWEAIDALALSVDQSRDVILRLINEYT
ncbi:helix-turn-helix domain-containing protein [Plantactinospora sp. WMMC1484]|uniref:helix-turn-helix domain-containing protein n=1 Tax=Plantactinospora sp. WMMC1484 TaxID=3404122 RepID=UPI003BF4A8DF